MAVWWLQRVLFAAPAAVRIAIATALALVLTLSGYAVDEQGGWRAQAGAACAIGVGVGGALRLLLAGALPGGKKCQAYPTSSRMG